MAIVEGWYPPTRENWETVVLVFRVVYPVVRLRHSKPFAPLT
jgi:hypothetical protein